MAPPNSEVSEAHRPRVAELDLSGARSAGTLETRPWSSTHAALDRIGAWSGSALALAVLLERELERPGGDAPLVLALGECVRAGRPTAARATLASRAPLTGLYAEGQVGSDLARRLAGICDALILHGRCRVEGAVLHVSRGGCFELLERPALIGLSPAETHARLERDLGPCATLSIGAGGEQCVVFASLAACASSQAGGGPPHYVGRGGLGCVLGRIGLKAIAVSAPAPPPERDDALIRALRQSPRLESRAQGGTFELTHALTARGDLRARNYAETLDQDAGERYSVAIESSRRGQHGCAGCPTPCGWTFANARGEGHAARFGASYALGLNLGLHAFEDSLELVAACDRSGLDAKEVGACLALLCEARERELIEGPAAWGDVAQLSRWIDELVSAAGDTGQGHLCRDGAQSLARRLGLKRRAFTVKGSSMRPESNMASLLAQCVSVRGTDPMRIFAFLASDGSGDAAWRVLTRELDLPAGAADPARSEGKGKLVWWHENLAVALDVTGFCAFSAAGLLADGVCSLDELARWIAPAALRGEATFAGAAGATLLAMGEELACAQRVLHERWCGEVDQDRPAWARERLDQPGMWPEYRRLRGLDASGRLEPRRRRAFEQAAALEVRLPASVALARAAATRSEPVGSGVGRIELCSAGSLARALGRPFELELPLPASLSSVLKAAEERRPAARRLLVRDDRILPAVYRSRQRLEAGDVIRDGDRLDLILAVAGG